MRKSAKKWIICLSACLLFGTAAAENAAEARAESLIGARLAERLDLSEEEVQALESAGAEVRSGLQSIHETVQSKVQDKIDELQKEQAAKDEGASETAQDAQPAEDTQESQPTEQTQDSQPGQETQPAATEEMPEASPAEPASDPAAEDSSGKEQGSSDSGDSGSDRGIQLLDRLLNLDLNISVKTDDLKSDVNVKHDITVPTTITVDRSRDFSRRTVTYTVNEGKTTMPVSGKPGTGTPADPNWYQLNMAASGNVNTGDSTMIWPWVLCLGCSGAAAAAILLLKDRKKAK